jgi:hypothetical protein
MDIRDVLRSFQDVPVLEGEQNNLCHSTVARPTVHPLCRNNLGIKRERMPQFEGVPVPRSIADGLKELGVLVPNQFGGVNVDFLFLKMLRNAGFPPGSPELVYAGELQPTQNEVVLSNVWKLVQKLTSNPGWQKEVIEQCYGRTPVLSSTQAITSPILVSDDLMILDGTHRAAGIIAAGQPSGESLICVRRIPLTMKQLIDVATTFASNIGIQGKKGV